MQTEKIKQRILSFLRQRKAISEQRGVVKSQMGFAAFPEQADRRTPQGMAFAVARPVNELIEEGLICNRGNYYYLTKKGRE